MTESELTQIHSEPQAPLNDKEGAFVEVARMFQDNTEKKQSYETLAP